MEQDSNLHMALLVHSEIRAMIHIYVEAKRLNMAQEVWDAPVPPCTAGGIRGEGRSPF